MTNYLDEAGLARVWTKMKAYVGSIVSDAPFQVFYYELINGGGVHLSRGGIS